MTARTPKPVLIVCTTPGGRHRWRWVDGVYVTPEHPYIERRCVRCMEYEGDIR